MDREWDLLSKANGLISEVNAWLTVTAAHEYAEPILFGLAVILLASILVIIVKRLSREMLWRIETRLVETLRREIREEFEQRDELTLQESGPRLNPSPIITPQTGHAPAIDDDDPSMSRVLSTMRRVSRRGMHHV